jgi:hypothetical protein
LIAVPFQVPVVIVPIDAKEEAVVRADREVRVPLDVATKLVAVTPGPVPVTSPVNDVIAIPEGEVQVMGEDPPAAEVKTCPDEPAVVGRLKL